MIDHNDVTPTDKQVRAVNAVIAGETNLGKAMTDAGYSEQTSHNPKQNFVASRGVQVYLETLDEKSKQKFSMSVVDKAMEVYLDALEAKKYVPGRATLEGDRVVYRMLNVPDHHIRLQAADRVVKVYGADKPKPEAQTYESPDLNSLDIKEFNKKFLKFMEQSS